LWLGAILTAWTAGVATTAAEVPSTYVIDLVAGAGLGADMNDRGDVVGTRYIDVGCGAFCLAPSEEVVWTGDDFTALPVPPDRPSFYSVGISGSGWVAGTASSASGSRAVVWKPAGDGYEIIDLGTLPGTTDSTAVGIDDGNRVVGYASGPFPQPDVPFMWTEADGLTDLTELGFPQYNPIAISPGGTVAYLYGWYRLDVPGVVMENVAPPSGFFREGYGAAINDEGNQLRLLRPTSGSNINYPFRYYNYGAWEQIWPSGGIDSSPFNVGTVTSADDISLTISATGLVAPGPGGSAEELTPRLSPAYGDAAVTGAGTINEAGEILAQVMIGNSPRLVRLVGAEPCTVDCMQVSAMVLRARFIDDPADPDQCNLNARTRAVVTMRVTDEAGNPLEGVQVTGHFFDDYVLDGLRQGTTNRAGIARFFHNGPPCVGAIAFLITDAVKEGRTFDRTSGTLQKWLIPVNP
jgi:hypothetical protein